MDDTARAIGTGGSYVTIAGKQCQCRPLGLVQLTELERICLKSFKREFIETFSENIDLLPEEERKGFVREKMEEAARWDVPDLPKKYAYDINKVKITTKLRVWLKDNIGFSIKDEKSGEYSKDVMTTRLKSLATTALDAGLLEESLYEELVGSVPGKMKIGYANWWVTAHNEGIITMLWICFKVDGLTKEDVVKEMEVNPDILTDLAREIEYLSAPKVGNG